MSNLIPRDTILPPPGSPCWKGATDLPLIYLGWGQRNFHLNPLILHQDRGLNYYFLLKGEITVTSNETPKIVTGPHGFIFDTECAFAINQRHNNIVEIITWIWQETPNIKHLVPPAGCFIDFPLKKTSIKSLKDLHVRCRNEVAKADEYTSQTLHSLKTLVEAELAREFKDSSPQNDLRWELANSWIANNLSIHAPVPALCDYLGMSPSTLNQFFSAHTQKSPGVYFRNLKIQEAKRLINMGLQLKAVAYQLGYKHPNDLCRALKTHESELSSDDTSL